MKLDNEGGTSKSIFAWDYVLWEVRLKLVALGFFLYLGVFFLSHCLSSWMVRTYHTLPAKEKVLWNLAAARGVFGIQSCVAGLWALLLDPVFQADKVYSQQDWSWFNCLIASGFFLFENVVLLFRTLDFFLLVHHIFASAGLCSLVINIKSGHYIPLIGILLEMCMPFCSVSLMLLKVGWANTLFWKVNQWITIHIFHCRMILLYHMWWVCISNWDALLENLGLLHFAVVFIGLSAFTFVLNPRWINKKTRQLLCPVDWKFTSRTIEKESSKNLNEKAFQKKDL